MINILYVLLKKDNYMISKNIKLIYISEQNMEFVKLLILK